MRDLDRLIRLHQWRLEERRQKVVELERLATCLRTEIVQLEERVAAEQKPISADPAGASCGDGASGPAARREKLERSLAALEGEMAQAAEDVTAAYREFEKFDLIRTRDRRREDRKRLRARNTSREGRGVGIGRNAGGT